MHPRLGTYHMPQITINAFRFSWLTQAARGSPTRSGSNIMPSQSWRLQPPTESLMPQQDSPLPLQESRKHLPTKWKPSSPSAPSYLATLSRSLHQHQAFFLLLQYLPPWLTSTNPSSFGTPRKFSHLRLLSHTIPTTLAPKVTLLQSLATTVMKTRLPPFTTHAHLVTITFAH
jgi:hypothetical protein